jgi:hypothetical protein
LWARYAGGDWSDWLLRRELAAAFAWGPHAKKSPKAQAAAPTLQAQVCDEHGGLHTPAPAGRSQHGLSVQTRPDAHGLVALQAASGAGQDPAMSTQATPPPPILEKHTQSGDPLVFSVQADWQTPWLPAVEPPPVPPTHWPEQHWLFFLHALPLALHSCAPAARVPRARVPAATPTRPRSVCRRDRA